ncbi:family 43 glycosylhydrolase [Brevundimonas goettingensis]|uniref:Family 43 glycosylhydrolase n=1 Tax=Brevundimonas goettingensis TaxID=2774190 RepID=A0A975GV95_9CAUL|nr:family 43 glycosylhydrolase [Brevundimonas goettingensis]QTC91152.1 family 43 glycosylhydrolase [Brevundimonas goettingensis]
MKMTRRGAFGLAALGVAAPTLAKAQTSAVETPAAPLNRDAARAFGDWTSMTWPKGIEGQRLADLGDGTFLNPILAGDHPDPSILKDGDTYYMTHSSFESVPGLTIWASKDLVNWTPIVAALTKNIGSVWAPELCKHDGRFFLYIPARTDEYRSSYVIHAEKIEGPWSEPVDLHLPNHIDPGHVVGEDGKRYLFLSGGDMIQLTDDGMATVGEVRHVYEPWRYPVDWDVEGFSPEGPKVLKHGDWFYMITAVGGTAGPPTGHMVIVARSKSVFGPWENHPRNPIVRTATAREKWWSRGHATLIEGPAGDWWTVYHGYENAFWTLGRQTLLDKIVWSADGWPDAVGGDLSHPMAKPANLPGQKHGMALSDDFSTDKFGVQWSFYNPGSDEGRRFRREGGVLHMAAKGAAPKDCSPLTFVQGEHAYEIECEIEIDEGVTAGLLLFYDFGLYAGLGFDEKRFVTHTYGMERGRPGHQNGRHMHMRMTNDNHIVTCYSSADGVTWTKFDRQMEVSGYHQNVRGGFMMLRPGIYAAGGSGEARFKNFKYRAL